MSRKLTGGCIVIDSVATHAILLLGCLSNLRQTGPRSLILLRFTLLICFIGVFKQLLLLVLILPDILEEVQVARDLKLNFLIVIILLALDSDMLDIRDYSGLCSIKVVIITVLTLFGHEAHLAN